MVIEAGEMRVIDLPKRIQLYLASNLPLKYTGEKYNEFRLMKVKDISKLYNEVGKYGVFSTVEAMSQNILYFYEKFGFAGYISGYMYEEVVEMLAENFQQDGRSILRHIDDAELNGFTKK